MSIDTLRQLQEVQISRQLEFQARSKRSARNVVSQHGQRHEWAEEEIQDVIDMLGLEEPPELTGSGWVGFNGRPDPSVAVR